jgi:hypothetical protein
MEASQCVNRMSDLINVSLENFPNTEIIASLATPRSDNNDWNNNLGFDCFGMGCCSEISTEFLCF